MAIPTLFPYGTGDIIGADPDPNKKSFVQKFRYLLKFCEINDNGTLDYRFAKHSLFVLWLYNLHYRHRTLAQGKIYISQNSEEANLLIHDFKSHIAQPLYNNPVLKSLSRYMASIPGSSGYWQRNGKDLHAIMENFDQAHAFITLTLADFHCPYLHASLNIPVNADNRRIKSILNENFHRVNWFFNIKFEIFINEYLVKYLKCSPEYVGWIWYRFEWQHRNSIHVHGLLKIGGAPNLARLTA
jgi:hypothetical protein